MEEANINILPRSLPRKTTSPGFRPAPPQGEREHLSRLGGIVGGGGVVVVGGGGGGTSQDREQTPSRGDTAWGHGRRSGDCFQCQMGTLSNCESFCLVILIMIAYAGLAASPRVLQ